MRAVSDSFFLNGSFSYNLHFISIIPSIVNRYISDHLAWFNHNQIAWQLAVCVFVMDDLPINKTRKKLPCTHTHSERRESAFEHLELYFWISETRTAPPAQMRSSWCRGDKANKRTQKQRNYNNKTNKARKIHDRKCRCHVGDACQSINSFYEMNQMDKMKKERTV